MEGDEAVEVRVKEDLRHIADWLEKSRKSYPLFIIGSHCDLDPNFDSENPANYLDAFNSLTIVQELIMTGGDQTEAKVILGHMDTPEGTEQLAFQIFQQVLK
jgi:hypothetical protein